MYRKSRAAIFIDYQNLYEGLQQAYKEPAGAILGLLAALRTHLEGRCNARAIIQQAYADFEHISQPHAVKQELILAGISPRFVPNDNKEASSQQLTVDVLDLLHHRTDLNVVTLVTGDRDYLPLVQHLLNQGRRVYVVALTYIASSALLSHVHDDAFIEAGYLLSNKQTAGDQAGDLGTFEAIQELPYEVDELAIEIIEAHFGHYKEIYLSPLLRKLSEELDVSSGHEPKAVIGDLETCGAARLEKRRGTEHDYTVLILNPEHPSIIAVRERFEDSEREFIEDRFTTIEAYDEESWDEEIPNEE